MKFAMKLLSLFFTVLILTNTAYAETPREQLKQMVGQLQVSQNDISLREKIIKLARQLKPAPAMPEEAERRMVRGMAAFKGAKSVADYEDAAQEFEQATLAAPWYGDAYFNLGVSQDKAENYEAALSSLKLALLASSNGKEIKALIYEVEYRNEKASSPEAQAEKKKQKEQERKEILLRSLDGAVFVGEAQGGDAVYEIHINGNEAAWEMHYVHIDKGSGNELNGHYVGQVITLKTQLTGLELTFTSQTGWKDYFEISTDGKTIKGYYGVLLQRR